jgi:hypothetical protein
VTPETSRQVQTLQVCGGSGWHQRKSAPLKKEHPFILRIAKGIFGLDIGHILGHD